MPLCGTLCHLSMSRSSLLILLETKGSQSYGLLFVFELIISNSLAERNGDKSFTVLRFTNWEVLHRIHDVLEVLRQWVDEYESQFDIGEVGS